VLSVEELQALAAVLSDHNKRHDRPVLLIVDEVYQRMVYPPYERVDPLALYEHTVLARSFSKDLGIAGERIGYLVLHPSMVSPDAHVAIAQSMRALGFVNAPATAQRALLHLTSWDINLVPYDERRTLVMRRMREAGLEGVEPQGGIYQWIRSPWPDTLALIDELARRRVLLTPGVAFGVPSHMRLCFSAPLAKLDMALEALADLAQTTVSA
jgi:aspartate aminotransferase